jgi:hypothetical protein
MVQIEFLKHKDEHTHDRIGNGKINPGKKYEKPATLNDEVVKHMNFLFYRCFRIIQKSQV